MLQQSQHGPTVSWENLKNQATQTRARNSTELNWIEVKWNKRNIGTLVHYVKLVVQCVVVKKLNGNEQQGKRKRMMFFFIYTERECSIMDGET